MKGHRWIKWALLALPLAILATFLVGSVALATHIQPGDSTGTLGISRPWGPADQDANNPLHVELTYTIKASGSVPDAAVQAVEAGITAWINAINTSSQSR